MSTRVIKNEVAKVAYSKYKTIDGVNVRDREAISKRIYCLRHDQDNDLFEILKIFQRILIGHDIKQIDADTIFIKTQQFPVEFDA